MFDPGFGCQNPGVLASIDTFLIGKDLDQLVQFKVLTNQEGPGPSVPHPKSVRINRSLVVIDRPLDVRRGYSLLPYRVMCNFPIYES